MGDLLDLINSLPLIMSYIVYGSLFLCIFNFITFKSKEYEIKHYFISCITVSFIIKVIFNWILNLWGTHITIRIVENTIEYYLLSFGFTAITAYLSGILFSSKCFNKLLLNLGTKRTANTNIWDDIIENETWLYIHIKNKDYGYLGLHKYSEENCSSPKIVLCHYQLIEMSTGEVVTDYSDDNNRLIMIDTKDVDTIEIIYRNPMANKKKTIFKIKSLCVLKKPKYIPKHKNEK